MASVVNKLHSLSLIQPPKWLPANTLYETMMGSEAYGVSSGSSDIDVYGFCLPPKDLVFPHLGGEIPGFGNQVQRFDQFQQHHVKLGEKEYDLSIYSIVRYFQLAMENNPNMLDSLFTPRRCVLHSTSVGEMVRDKKKIFLHKGSFHKLRGYAYAQLSKLNSGANKENEKRQEDMIKYGYSTKFAYHLVRLILQAEQILIEHDLDIERNREILKSIRRGEWTIERIHTFFTDKEKQLQDVYVNSTLRDRPDEAEIKQLLLDCMESHYGSMKEAVVVQTNYELIFKEIQAIIERNT